MTHRKEPGFDLRKKYVFLEDGGAAPSVEVTETFWRELMGGSPSSEAMMRISRGDGWLAGVYTMNTDSAGWEMHPAGEEILFLLSGSMAVILEMPDEEHLVELHPGQACIVPRGTWHRLIVYSPGEMIGITYGKGTRHRPLEA